MGTLLVAGMNWYSTIVNSITNLDTRPAALVPEWLILRCTAGVADVRSHLHR